MDHSELLTEARELADELHNAVKPYSPNSWSEDDPRVPPDPATCVHAFTTLRALAIIIEDYDKQPNTDTVNDEAITACQACDVAIDELCKMMRENTECCDELLMEKLWDSGAVERLDAAGHLAKRVAEAADALKASKGETYERP